MGAKNATIKKDATAMTPTGGTDIIYSITGKQIPGGFEVQDAAVIDFTIRPTAEVKTRVPTMGKDGYYTKRKIDVKLVRPVKRADGSTAFSVWRITNETPVELPSNVFVDDKFRACQFISDLDFAALWSDGNLD